MGTDQVEGKIKIKEFKDGMCGIDLGEDDIFGFGPSRPSGPRFKIINIKFLPLDFTQIQRNREEMFMKDILDEMDKIFDKNR